MLAEYSERNKEHIGRTSLSKLGMNRPDFAVWVGFALTVVLVDAAVGLPAYGQTFSQAQSATLSSICDSLPLFQLSANLRKRCFPRKAAPGSSVTVNVTSAAPPSLNEAPSGSATIIRERLQQIRAPIEEKPESMTKTRIYAFNGTSNRAGDAEAVPLPPVTSGAFPGVVLGLAPGLSLYLSADGSTLTHSNNRFEDGYDATVPTVTVGGDYLINPRLLAGLAFTYNNIDGHYDDGSGFNQNSYGGFLYATLLPFNAAFANVTLGYARQDNSNKRPVARATTAIGRASSNYDTNQYTAAMLAGYDYPIGNVTIGPRLGASFAHWQTDDFTEHGSTGLELRYSGLDQTSVQTSLGVQGTIAIRRSFGLLLPQAAVAWVHEFANDARNVQAQFLEASPSPEFTFKREPPARDWANIGVGITAILPNGLQPFVQFATMQGNKNFASYGGTAGVRLGL